MRSLVHLFRVLCIALLLPATMVAAAQTDHVPAKPDCCGNITPEAHHADASPQTAQPAGNGHGGPSHETLHLACGIHACNWLEASVPVAARPNDLVSAVLAPSVPPSPLAARAEPFHRPPAALH
ncbi:hypothetical protein [Histidinibacterium aquaticum]|uniref:DUF2946 domain-containing protein n=1 Tax=Histidinibacterium aquaticum TaxID=2613962 RepID=A0A5J5GKN4_9RHOB|nr:hypothetical protein [Histidinibacterium aquaticum]KAA9008849.1 hypothetical protein F3S47_06180 [Histidinibacterium aquaticum]